MNRIERKNLILDLIKQIRESESKWKAKYIVWNYKRKIETSIKRKAVNSIVRQHITDSKKNPHFYPVENYSKMLGEMDYEIAAQGLIWAVSLTEAAMDEFLRYKGFIIDRNTGRTEKLMTLKELGVITPDEEKEFILAKETRNCFTHNAGHATPEWKSAWVDARQNLPDYSVGERMLPRVPWIEKWHDSLFVKIADTIESKL